MKKVVRKVEFASFNLKKDKTGSFHQAKSVNASTDHELLLQIASGLKVVQTNLKVVQADVKDVKTRVTNLEYEVKTINIRLTNVESVLKRNNLK
ncbi:MAG: hypothetical protein LBF00_03830 [Mycoplasmataceae bacterium]|jgi:regulatory protein YycI of two-component signal transduction system YycFG|nr:hypothetical protein [Mycoplasmataceae bacterium]